MRKGRASTSSNLVTLMRALADGGLSDVRGFADPTAIRLLTRPWQLAGRAILSVAHGARRGGSARVRPPQRWRRGLELVALRTRALDDAWHASHQRGSRQLVILGAGLDGRAFRLEDLSDVIVFEVDHPSTQSLKRERIKTLNSRAREHRFVPVDFERDSLFEELRAAGQSPGVMTFWLWEGVTTYLTAAAQQVTLDAVAALSAPGSRIAMTYIEPGGGSGVSHMMRLFGEPHIGLMTRATAAERLARAGLRVIDDTGVDEWRRRYADSRGASGEAWRARIAVGDR
jgi:methyltransferase (TIGR00027 family)